MSKKYILLLALVISTGAGFSQTTFAQQSNGDDQVERESSIDNIFADCQDSILLEAFPLLRNLIDLLNQLVDLLNQAGALIDGGGLIDPGNIDPGSFDPGSFDPSDLDPSDLDPSDLDPSTLDPSNLNADGGGSITAQPGGWGIGPIPSVP